MTRLPRVSRNPGRGKTSPMQAHRRWRSVPNNPPQGLAKTSKGKPQILTRLPRVSRNPGRNKTSPMQPHKPLAKRAKVPNNPSQGLSKTSKGKFQNHEKISLGFAKPVGEQNALHAVSRTALEPFTTSSAAPQNTQEAFKSAEQSTPKV